MTKITLTDLASLQNETTAISAINSNNAVLETASDNTLSRDGTAPNQMLSNLDMNGYQILNEGALSYTVSTLPVSPVVGQQAVVTDGTAGLAWGATVTGGSSTKYLVWFNNAAWTVIGK